MYEHHAIVPNANRTAVLVVDERLPFVASSERRPQPAVTAALAEEHDVHATFLRTVRRTDNHGEVTALLEFDAAPCPTHARWLDLDALDPEAVAPVFADGLADWVVEQRSEVPAERAPWARPGWLREAARWVAAVVPSAGEPRLVRQWPLSAMYAFDSEPGPLYFKACFVLWPHEPALTALLAREHPGRIPEVVATNDEHGWLLMRQLDGPDVADANPQHYEEELRFVADLQRSWSGRIGELPIAQRPLRQLVDAAPELHRLCARLEEFGIPETLTHGDLHQWNAVVVEDRVVVLDWSDAAIAHPFLDLGAALFYAGEDYERDALIAAYLEPWGDDASLREAAAIGEALGCAYQAISFRAINAAFEPADRWLFAGEWDRWMTRATELAAGL